MKELENAPSDMDFCQKIQDDTVKVKIEPSPIFGGCGVEVKVIDDRRESSIECKLRAVEKRIYRSATTDPMDMGAISNVLSSALVRELAFIPKLNERSITVATGRKFSAVWLLKIVPMPFETLIANLEFLVVEGSH